MAAARSRTPSVLRRLLYMLPGLAILTTGALIPLPSYLERQAALEDFDRQMEKPRQAIRAYLATLKPGEITRDYVGRRLARLRQQETNLHNKLAPAVNQAIALQRERQVQGLCVAAVGAILLGIAVVLGRSRRHTASFPDDYDRLAGFEDPPGDNYHPPAHLEETS